MRLELAGLRLPLAHFELELDCRLDARVVAICGPSGAGKSTVLELVAGLRRPAAGRIALGDQVLADVARGVFLPPPARHLGYVPQDLALFPHLTVEKNLRYGLGRAGASPPPTGDIVRVLGLGSLLQRRPAQLSGGEKQRVALGRALFTSPRLLLLDEPLTGLDPRLRLRVLDYLREIRDAFHIPMLYVTHDATDAAAIAEEVLWIEQGKLLARGPVAEMLEPDPAAFRLRATVQPPT